MWKKLPNWVKVLAVISTILVVVFFLLAAIILFTFSDIGGVSAFVYLAYAALIIGMWALGYINAILVLKEKTVLANAISVIILSGMLFYFGWAFTWQFLNYPEQMGTFVQNAFWTLPYGLVVMYLIVVLILINKKSWGVFND